MNATAPHPVTNRHLARALGRAMRRPSLMPAPGFALKIVVGEFAESLLTGQRVAAGACAEERGITSAIRKSSRRSEGSFGE